MSGEQTYWLLRILTATGPGHSGSNAGAWLKAFDKEVVQRAVDDGLLDRRRLVLSVTEDGAAWLSRREYALTDPDHAAHEAAMGAAVDAIDLLVREGDDGDELKEELLSMAADASDRAAASHLWGESVSDPRRGVIQTLRDLASDERTRPTSEGGVTPPRSRVDALKAAVAAIRPWHLRPWDRP